MQLKDGSLGALIRLENHLQTLFLNEERRVFTIRDKEEDTGIAVTQEKVKS